MRALVLVMCCRQRAHASTGPVPASTSSIGAPIGRRSRSAGCCWKHSTRPVWHDRPRRARRSRLCYYWMGTAKKEGMFRRLGLLLLCVVGAACSDSSSTIPPNHLPDGSADAPGPADGPALPDAPADAPAGDAMVLTCGLGGPE